jgi:hypothetical protein
MNNEPTATVEISAYVSPASSPLNCAERGAD